MWNIGWISNHVIRIMAIKYNARPIHFSVIEGDKNTNVFHVQCMILEELANYTVPISLFPCFGAIMIYTILKLKAIDLLIYFTFVLRGLILSRDKEFTNWCVYLLTWFNFNPNMDKQPHTWKSVGWNYLSMMESKLIHVNKMGSSRPGDIPYVHHYGVAKHIKFPVINR